MNKKAMVREIIQPIMDEKGFVLIHDKQGIWTWTKEVHGVDEKINVVDLDGMLSLEIGISRNNVEASQGSRLLKTLDNPRTKYTEWDYLLSKDREGTYRNILQDFRDILEKNCDTEIEKNAKKLKKVIEESTRRFTLFCDEYDELKKIYGEQFKASEMPVNEVIDQVLDRVVEYHGRPLREVENELVGYAVLIESLLIKKDGVKKHINLEYQTSILINDAKDTVNVLGDVFYVWKDKAFLPIAKRKMMRFA